MMEGINPGLALYAPQWYSRLTTQSIDEVDVVEYKGDFGSTEFLAINNCTHCIVGEAHGFTEEYTRRGSCLCWQCLSFSSTLYRAITQREETHLKSLIDRFVDHCEIKHLKEVPMLIATA